MYGWSDPPLTFICPVCNKTSHQVIECQPVTGLATGHSGIFCSTVSIFSVVDYIVYVCLQANGEPHDGIDDVLKNRVYAFAFMTLSNGVEQECRSGF
jgi:hypothetical protein